MANSRNTIELKLENGDTLSAPLGIWLAALLATLSPEQQTSVKEHVGQMMKQQSLLVPRGHVLKADPLNLNFRTLNDGSI